MKKDYNKPVLEIVEFEYNVLTESATEGTGETEINVEDWF